MILCLPEQDEALALDRSEYCPSGDQKSFDGSTASIGIDAVSPGATGGRYCASMQGCASPFPIELLQAGELLPSSEAEVQPRGRLWGGLRKLEGCPGTKAQHLQDTEAGCCWAAGWRHLTRLQTSGAHCYLQTLSGSCLPIMRPYRPVRNKEESACRAAHTPLASTFIPLRSVIKTQRDPGTWVCHQFTRWKKYFLFCFLCFV